MKGASSQRESWTTDWEKENRMTETKKKTEELSEKTFNRLEGHKLRVYGGPIFV